MVQWVNDPAYLYCNIADSSCCLAQCVEYPMLPQLQLQFDSWSGNFHMLPGQPIKGGGNIYIHTHIYSNNKPLPSLPLPSPASLPIQFLIRIFSGTTQLLYGEGRGKKYCPSGDWNLELKCLPRRINQTQGTEESSYSRLFLLDIPPLL